METINKFFVVLLALSCIQILSCRSNQEKHEVEHPAIVEDIEGSDLSKITLTERAAKRIGLQTAKVTEVNQSPKKLVVPYSSIIYDFNGQAWVYTSPEERTFVRHKIDIDRIQGNNVFLNDGPAEGTVVATVGVAELYGAEFKVGH